MNKTKPTPEEQAYNISDELAIIFLQKLVENDEIIIETKWDAMTFLGIVSSGFIARLSSSNLFEYDYQKRKIMFDIFIESLKCNCLTLFDVLSKNAPFNEGSEK